MTELYVIAVSSPSNSDNLIIIIILYSLIIISNISQTMNFETENTKIKIFHMTNYPGGQQQQQNFSASLSCYHFEYDELFANKIKIMLILIMMMIVIMRIIWTNEMKKKENQRICQMNC